VARVYAGILGPLALLTTLADGYLHARDPLGVLFVAWLSLIAFAAIGGIAGWLAERIVDESVASVVRAELLVQAVDEKAAEHPAAE
jgi:hypothetical protein